MSSKLHGWKSYRLEIKMKKNLKMIIRDVIIYDILIPSLKRLYQEDYDNIRLVNENEAP